MVVDVGGCRCLVVVAGRDAHKNWFGPLDPIRFGNWIWSKPVLTEPVHIETGNRIKIGFVFQTRNRIDPRIRNQF